MSKVYFTSDLHIGHEKLCQGLRGMSAKDSWELIKTNWNNTVKKNDKVYILGDLTMHNQEEARKILALNGNKVLIAGNHDSEGICRLMFELGIPVLASKEYKGFICTHIPIHDSEMTRFNGNIHGHIHLPNTGYEYNMLVTNDKRYFNVNVEFNNYTPVLFDDIVKYYEDKRLIKENVKIRNEKC